MKPRDACRLVPLFVALATSACGTRDRAPETSSPAPDTAPVMNDTPAPTGSEDAVDAREPAEIASAPPDDGRAPAEVVVAPPDPPPADPIVASAPAPEPWPDHLVRFERGTGPTLDEESWSALTALDRLDATTARLDGISVTYRSGVLRVGFDYRPEAFERRPRLDERCAPRLDRAWVDARRETLVVRLALGGTCDERATTFVGALPSRREHAGWRVIDTPLMALPTVEDLCRGNVRLASMLAPFGVVDYASLADYSEQGNDSSWARLATGGRARRLARSAFVPGGDWCSECYVDPETRHLECDPAPFEPSAPDDVSFCERRGYGHGGSLVCFDRRDARSPWYVSLIGGAEEGNEVQDAEVDAALSAWRDLLGRSADEPSPSSGMLGGPEAPCFDELSGVDRDMAVLHLKAARAARSDRFARRYHLYLAVRWEPTGAEARLALARELVVIGDRRGAYRELLILRALGSTALAALAHDASFAPLAAEPLFQGLVGAAPGPGPCRLPEADP